MAEDLKPTNDAARPKVLIAGKDRALLETRAALLQRKYAVTACGRLIETLFGLQTEGFDLLLVCTSMTHDEATQVIRQVRDALPDICIIRLLSRDSPEIDHQVSNEVVTITYHPEVWIKAVDKLLLSEDCGKDSLVRLKTESRNES